MRPLGPVAAALASSHALRGIPEERVRYHLCWGSMNTSYPDSFSEGGTAKEVYRKKGRGRTMGRL